MQERFLFIKPQVYMAELSDIHILYKIIIMYV